MMILLDIGGGNQPHIEEGYITIATDRHDFREDYKDRKDCQFVIHDILTPLPFEDNSIDKCYSHHCLEHLPQSAANGEDALIFAMKEMTRVTKPGGAIQVIVPWIEHTNAWRHPAHYRFFNYEVFNWFDAEYPSPDLEAYNFPRVLKCTVDTIVDNCHVMAIFTKLEKPVIYKQL